MPFCGAETAILKQVLENAKIWQLLNINAGSKNKHYDFFLTKFPNCLRTKNLWFIYVSKNALISLLVHLKTNKSCVTFEFSRLVLSSFYFSSEWASCKTIKTGTGKCRARSLIKKWNEHCDPTSLNRTKLTLSKAYKQVKQVRWRGKC